VGTAVEVNVVKEVYVEPPVITIEIEVDVVGEGVLIDHDVAVHVVIDVVVNVGAV